MKKLTQSEIREIQLNMMKNFSDFCEQHNLYYVLTYGTLIGAVRHKGMIPWDDDIDVMMPRDDYAKLIDLYKKEIYIDNTELLFSTDTNEYYYPFAKLCDARTVAKMRSNLTRHGIWIDIFPVDKIPESPKEASKFQKKMVFFRRMIIAGTSEFKNIKISMKKVAKRTLWIIVMIKGKKNLTIQVEKEAQKYNKTSSKLLCPVAFQAVSGGIIKEQEFYDRIKVPFEQYEFYIPRNYDSYLSNLYGSYMELPPKNKRTTHGLDVYYKDDAE